MRILLLSSSMGMGGADKQLLSAAQEMRCRGHEVFIVSLTVLGPMGLEARRLGIPTESLEMRRGVPDPRGLVRLIQLVRAHAALQCLIPHDVRGVDAAAVQAAADHQAPRQPPAHELDTRRDALGAIAAHRDDGIGRRQRIADDKDVTRPL